MLFQPAVLLLVLLPIVNGMISKWTPDRCWMNKNPNEPEIPGVCPIFHTNLKVPVYCSINLTPDSIENEKCRRCVWRENTESLCQPTKHWQRRMCCCKRPMCNKEIYMDAMPGWDMTKKRQEEHERVNPGEIHCIAAKFEDEIWHNYSNDNTTIENYKVETLNKTTKASPLCYFNMTVNGGKMISMDMGIASNENLDIVKKCNDMKDKHQHLECEPRESNKTGITNIFCCCNKHWCNQELYMRRGFDAVMEVRQKKERKYKKDIEDAKKKVPARIWYNNEKYHNAKPVVDGVLIIGTAVYILAILAAYRLYIPVDMDKRVAPQGASKERVAAE